MGLFFYRMMGAAMLDHSMYEGIEADRTVTVHAGGAVLLSSLAAGMGGGGWYGGGFRLFATFSVIALVTWLVWAMLIFQIGTRFLPESETRTTLGELLRTTGFAASPGLLLVFAVFPRMAVPVFAATMVWIFVAMVVGVRHALDYQSTARALAVCAIAASVSAVVAVGVAAALGIGVARAM